MLSDEEIAAVCEFLQKQVKPFGPGRIRKRVLVDLIKRSDLIEVEGPDH